MKLLEEARALAPELLELKQDLHRRPVYRRLLQTGMFQTAVVLQPDQTYTVEELHTG